MQYRLCFISGQKTDQAAWECEMDALSLPGVNAQFSGRSAVGTRIVTSFPACLHAETSRYPSTSARWKLRHLRDLRGYVRPDAHRSAPTVSLSISPGARRAVRIWFLGFASRFRDGPSIRNTCGWRTIAQRYARFLYPLSFAPH